MRLVGPTMARTLSSSISLVAGADTWAGVVCRVSTMSVMGGLLIPPLSFTQAKYACAIPVMPVKSTPGCLVAIAPRVIGSPVAFMPVPRPHPGMTTLAEESVPPPEPMPPQAPTASEIHPRSIATTTDDRRLDPWRCITGTSHLGPRTESPPARRPYETRGGEVYRTERPPGGGLGRSRWGPSPRP